MGYVYHNGSGVLYYCPSCDIISRPINGGL